MYEHGLKKAVWDENDFEEMGWHDAHIYCVAIFPTLRELVLDIDYIVKWVKPVPSEKYFGFWVAPATLVFKSVSNIFMENALDHGFDYPGVGPLPDIFGITREPLPETKNRWRWNIDQEIAFDASGYTQYFRAAPTYTENQHLDLENRGGISLSRTPIQLASE